MQLTSPFRRSWSRNPQQFSLNPDWKPREELPWFDASLSLGGCSIPHRLASAGRAAATPRLRFDIALRCCRWLQRRDCEGSRGPHGRAFTSCATFHGVLAGDAHCYRLTRGMSTITVSRKHASKSCQSSAAYLVRCLSTHCCIFFKPSCLCMQ